MGRSSTVSAHVYYAFVSKMKEDYSSISIIDKKRRVNCIASDIRCDASIHNSRT